jgi:hypothetical protein
MKSTERAYPLRVIRVVLTERRALPVYPDKQTKFRVRRHVSKVPRAAVPAKSHFDPERKFGLVTKFDILIRAKRNGLERPSERALQSLTGVRIEPAPVAENDAFWLP